MLANFTSATRKFSATGIYPRAALTWGMPLPEASVANFSIKNPDRNPPVSPIKGNAIQAGISWAIWTRHPPSQPMPSLSTTAAKPATKPIRQASIMANLLGFSHVCNAGTPKAIKITEFDGLHQGKLP